MNSIKSKQTPDRIKQISFDKSILGSERNAKVIKLGGILSHYVTLSGREIKRSRDKIFYYLMGLCFLFTVISIPLAKIFIEPSQQWIVVLIPLIVIILSFARERKTARANNIYVVSASSQEEKLQGIITNSEESGKAFEIEMYWGYRPIALNDMCETIKQCRNGLFIAGMGLNTVADALCDPGVIRSLATAKMNYPSFEIQIVMLGNTDNIRCSEEGGSQLPEQLRRGRESLKRFYDVLNEQVPSHFPRPLVKFQTYDSKTLPRHFILKADDTIFAGSYLSHKKGSYSYLFKLNKANSETLFELFHDEVEYLKKHSVQIGESAFSSL